MWPVPEKLRAERVGNRAAELWREAWQGRTDILPGKRGGIHIKISIHIYIYIYCNKYIHKQTSTYIYIHTHTCIGIYKRSSRSVDS